MTSTNACIEATCDVHQMVAGVDEVGRGPLAGPVVAAAVILDPNRPIPGLRDSKALSAKQRRMFAAEIRCNAHSFALGFASVQEIDSINILQASLLAMERAVLKLDAAPLLVQVDGNYVPQFQGTSCRFAIESVIGGDRLIPAISAASILAKVCRDRLLTRLHRRYPQYAFDANKGYPTRAHVEALGAHGPCPIHRRSFGPVRRAAEATAR